MISKEAEDLFNKGNKLTYSAMSDLIRAALKISRSMIKDNGDAIDRFVVCHHMVVENVSRYFNCLVEGDFPHGVVVDRLYLRELAREAGRDYVEEETGFEHLDDELASAIERLYMGYRDMYSDIDPRIANRMLAAVSDTTERMLDCMLEMLIEQNSTNA